MTMSERVQQLRRSRTPFVHATVVRAQQPDLRACRRRSDPVVRRHNRGLRRWPVRAELGAQGGARCAAGGRKRAAAGAARRRRPLPGGAGRLRRGQPVPVRRRAGDLPRPAGARTAGAHLRRHPDRRSAGRDGAPRSVMRCTDDGESTTWRRPTAVVIATHGGPEAEMIRAALDAGVGYVGLVASRVRGGAILDGLDLTDAERRRVHTPSACRSVRRRRPRSPFPSSPRSSGPSESRA